MYGDITFRLLAEEEDNSVYYSSNYAFQSFGSDELLSLLKNKFANQAKNLIKFLNNRKQFLEYGKRLKSEGIVPTNVPIELICDCTVHLNIFETFNRVSFEEIMAWVPGEIFCISNKQVLLSALNYRGILVMASDELKSDPELILKAIETEGRLKKGSFKFASKSLRSNHQFLLDAIEIDADILKYADSSVRNDPEFMRKTISKHLYCFRYVGGDLQGDEEFINSLMIENSLAIACMGELARSLFDDQERGEETLQLFETFVDMSRSDLIEHVKGICHDKDLMKQLLRCDGSLLEYCTEDLRNDKAVVTIAVKNKGSSLKFASPHLKMDREIVNIACKDSAENFKYASDSLRSDFDFIIENLKNDIDLVPYHTADIDEMLKLIGFYCYDEFIEFSREYFPDLDSNLDLLEKIIERCWKVKDEFSDWSILEHVSEEVIPALQKEVLLKVVRMDDSNYEKVPAELKHDREILAAHITNQVNQSHYDQFTKLSQEVAFDFEFIKLLIDYDIDYHVIEHVPELASITAITSEFVKKWPQAFTLCPEFYLDDVQFIENSNIMAIEFAREMVQLAHLDLVSKAIQKNPNLLSRFSDDIQIELLKKHKPDLLQALSQNYDVYAKVCEEIQIDHDVILTCVGSTFGGHLAEIFIEHDIWDRDLFFNLVKKNGFAYQAIREVVSEDDDEELSLEALKSWGWFDSSLLYHYNDAKVIYKIFKKLLNQRLKAFYTEDFYIPSRYSSLTFKLDD